MCVLYVSFGSKVRPRIFRCVAMGRAVLFILSSRLLLYSAGSGTEGKFVCLHLVLYFFETAKNLCRYVCMHFLSALVLVDVMVMLSA